MYHLTVEKFAQAMVAVISLQRNHYKTLTPEWPLFWHKINKTTAET